MQKKSRGGYRPVSWPPARGVRLAQQVQSLFNTDRFRVDTNTDILGVELAGALKNVIAIAAGICDGLGFGTMPRMPCSTRGLVEMTRFGTRLGAQSETFTGLAGIGDLMTTVFRDTVAIVMWANVSAVVSRCGDRDHCHDERRCGRRNDELHGVYGTWRPKEGIEMPITAEGLRRLV